MQRREARQQHRLSVIRPALRCLPGPERSNAIRDIASKEHVDHLGRPQKYDRATLYRWIDRYNERGLHGLESQRRDDEKQQRVIVSELFDQASGLPAETLAGIDRELKAYVKNRYANDLNPSRRLIAWDASLLLKTLARAAGFSGTHAELRNICRVPEHYVRRHRKYNVVAVFRKDAKVHADKQLIRVARNYDALPPMALVTADNRHEDILLRRADGATFTAKLCCFLDVATNRVFHQVVFPPPGRAVRQEHTVRALIAMTQDPEWGMPAILALDHGSEFGKFDMVKDALALAGPTHAQNARVLYGIDDPQMAAFVAGRLDHVTCSIRRARAYNPPGKPKIEGRFGVLTQWFLSRLPGWIAGDRMRKPTQMVGREPECFPGTQEEFLAALKVAFDYYHSVPQRTLKGRSPREAFEAAKAAGWQRVDVSAAALHEVFSDAIPCTIRQGSIKIKGLDGRYWAPELAQFPAGTRVTAFSQVAGDNKNVALRDEYGKFICFVVPVPVSHVLDERGAGWGQQAIRAQNEILHHMLTETSPIDAIADMRGATVDLQPTQTAESGATIFLDSKAHEVARKRRALPAPAASKLAINPEVERWRRLAPSYVETDTADNRDPPMDAIAKRKRGHL